MHRLNFSDIELDYASVGIKAQNEESWMTNEGIEVKKQFFKEDDKDFEHLG